MSKSPLFNYSLLSNDYINEIHKKLLEHNINKYMIGMTIGKPMKDTIILRPATHSETELVDSNYKNIPKLLNLPCPCVMLTINKILIIGFPPLSVSGKDWSSEIPNFSDWINTNNLESCKLCGINVSFNETKFCCKLHNVLYHSKLKKVKKDWNFKI